MLSRRRGLVKLGNIVGSMIMTRIFALCPPRLVRRLLSTSTSHPSSPSSSSVPYTYTPPPASLAFRSALSTRLAALRNPRPHTPFYNLAAAHRRPTLWTLYRRLRRLAPSDAVRLRIRRFFERWRSLTSPRITREKLTIAHHWLAVFERAAAGDERAHAVVQRYARLVAVRFEKEHMARLVRDEIHWRHRLRTRAILTGGYMRSTLANGPLPRMKPQPVHVTGMIVSRLRARTHRSERQTELFQWREDLRVEGLFESALKKRVEGDAGRERKGSESGREESEESGHESGSELEEVFGGNSYQEWLTPIKGELAEMQNSFARDNERKMRPFSPSLLAQIRAAKVERIANKRRELVREKAGEETKSMRVRRRKSYPTGVMDRWSGKKRREMVYVRRGIGEAGWAGELKRKMGWKVRGNEDTLYGEAKERVEAMEGVFAKAERAKARTRRASVEK